MAIPALGRSSAILKRFSLDVLLGNKVVLALSVLFETFSTRDDCGGELLFETVAIRLWTPGGSGKEAMLIDRRISVSTVFSCRAVIMEIDRSVGMAGEDLA